MEDFSVATGGVALLVKEKPPKTGFVSAADFGVPKIEPQVATAVLAGVPKIEPEAATAVLAGVPKIELDEVLVVVTVVLATALVESA